MDVILLAMPHTDERGVSYDASVWFPVLHTEDRLAKSGAVVWYGYRDSNALLAGLAPIGQHQVQVDAATFLAGASMAPSGATQGANSAALDIYLAENILDTPALDSSGNPTYDDKKKPIMQSFFKSATQVALTIPD